MARITRRRVLAALLLLLVAAFLLVKIAPARQDHPPQIVIRSEGGDQRLTRSVLASALERLFPKGNGTWKLRPTPAGDQDTRCVTLSPGYRRSTGRAVTATYVFAGWLEVRLADYIYPAATDPAAILGASRAAQTVAHCQAQLIAEGLRTAGYVVGEPRVLPMSRIPIGDGAASYSIVVPSRYKGRSFDWEYASTSARRGNLVLVVATLTGKSSRMLSQEFARELLPGTG